MAHLAPNALKVLLIHSLCAPRVVNQPGPAVENIVELVESSDFPLTGL